MVLYTLPEVPFQFLNKYFMHSFNKYLLRAYNVPGILLRARDYLTNKTVNSLKLQSQFLSCIMSREIGIVLVNDTLCIMTQCFLRVTCTVTINLYAFNFAILWAILLQREKWWRKYKPQSLSNSTTSFSRKPNLVIKRSS